VVAPRKVDAAPRLHAVTTGSIDRSVTAASMPPLARRPHVDATSWRRRSSGSLASEVDQLGKTEQFGVTLPLAHPLAAAEHITPVTSSTSPCLPVKGVFLAASAALIGGTTRNDDRSLADVYLEQV
jgi:hypothetical protein